MRITINKQEMQSLFNAIDQLNNLIENGAEGDSLRVLIRDTKHLGRLHTKAKAARDKVRRA